MYNMGLIITSKNVATCTSPPVQKQCKLSHCATIQQHTVLVPEWCMYNYFVYGFWCRCWNQTWFCLCSECYAYTIPFTRSYHFLCVFLSFKNEGPLYTVLLVLGNLQKVLGHHVYIDALHANKLIPHHIRYALLHILSIMLIEGNLFILWSCIIEV